MVLQHIFLGFPCKFLTPPIDLMVFTASTTQHTQDTPFLITCPLTVHTQDNMYSTTMNDFLE